MQDLTEVIAWVNAVAAAGLLGYVGVRTAVVGHDTLRHVRAGDRLRRRRRTDDDARYLADPALAAAAWRQTTHAARPSAAVAGRGWVTGRTTAAFAVTPGVLRQRAALAGTGALLSPAVGSVGGAAAQAAPVVPEPREEAAEIAVVPGALRRSRLTAALRVLGGGSARAVVLTLDTSLPPSPGGLAALRGVVRRAGAAGVPLVVVCGEDGPRAALAAVEGLRVAATVDDAVALVAPGLGVGSAEQLA